MANEGLVSIDFQVGNCQVAVRQLALTSAQGTFLHMMAPNLHITVAFAMVASSGEQVVLYLVAQWRFLLF